MRFVGAIDASPAPFAVSSEHAVSVRLVVSGELDLAGADRLSAAVWDALEEEPGTLTVDLSQTTFIDSTGICALLTAFRLTESRPTTLLLVPGPPQVQRVFQIYGLGTVLPFLAAGDGPTRGFGRETAAAESRADQRGNRGSDGTPEDQSQSVLDLRTSGADRTEMRSASISAATVDELHAAADRRDAAAHHRDLAAQARDRAADARDRSASEHERGPAVEARAQAALDRAAAAIDRRRAADDRRQSAADRDFARDAVAQAHLDGLTETYRREMGTALIQREIDRADRTGGPLVLAFVDVDGLKDVNDREGHAAGDRLITDVVQALRNNLRSYDPIVRFGDDEFVCALAGTDVDGATRRFAAVRAELADSPSGASISVGIAILEPDDTLEQLLDRGEAALYAAKRRR